MKELLEALSDYEIVNTRGHYEAYKDGELICTGDTRAEVEADLEELENQETKSKYLVTWIITNTDDNAVHKSLEIEAENEREAMNKVTDKNARDIRAVKLESLSSFAEDFNIYENLWD